MKKLRIWLFILFISAAALYAIFQSDFIRNYTRHLLTQSLQNSGFTVTINRFEGTLPHQIDLKGVLITGNGAQVSIEELHLRPILWRLFKKEIAFTQIRAKGISLSQGIPPLDFEGRFKINRKRAIVNGHISGSPLAGPIYGRFDLKKKWLQFKAKNRYFSTKGTGTFDQKGTWRAAEVHLASSSFSQNPNVSGHFLAQLLFTPEEGGVRSHITWQIPQLTIEKRPVGKVEGMGNFLFANRTLKGELTMAPFTKASFDMEIRPGFLLSGANSLTIENLQALHLPNLFGKLEAKAIWSLVDQMQELHLDAAITDFYYGAIFAQKVSLYSDLTQPFQKLGGLVDLEIEQGRWHDLRLETASLETVRREEDFSYKLFAEGTWKHPLELHMNGSWTEDFSANIDTLTGTFYHHPLALNHPVHLEWTKDRFSFPETELSIGSARAFLSLNRKGARTEGAIRFVQLPLDFLSLNPLEVPIAGTLDLNAILHEEKDQLRGNFQAAIEQLEPIPAQGTFEGQFDPDLLQLKGHIDVRNAPLVHLDLSLPIHFSLWPFEASLLFHKQTKGHIAMNGKVEEFLDFVDLGPHRLEGQCTADFRWSNTLYRPLVEGYLLFEDGFYENYYTGTQLQRIQADLLAEKNKIYLRSFHALDSSEAGSVTATGEMELLQSSLYPFQIDLNVKGLKFLEIDLVSAVADGKIHLEGNSTSAVAKGAVEITQSDLAIPNHIPRPLPNLQVVYRNPVHPVPPPQTEYHPYPLYLDLQVKAPQTISISGRGLTSEWKGDFHLGGTYTSLSTQGKLELVSGEFNFSSRTFHLTEGSISFSGREYEMPYLNLAGSMETKGISIIARLKGPLNNPQITLQSVPPLPLGSIMSYLLFGQDLSEISGFQALQIATSLASLAGTGPDVLESTRRSLGIDRLRVITDPTGEGGETVALQVGKYVSEGVLVSFTQGTEDSSPNISVEIELKNNFIFQIESDQHQEQGRFTLKWNRNY